MSQSSAIYPVFINCYNRFKPLLQLIAWLERAGQRRIYLVDNASTYPPLLAYYERTPYAVIRLGRNIGHRAVWEAGVLDQYAANEYYVMTDPDVVPDEQCPLDALAYFRNILDRYPAVCKVGFGLRIDNLPDHYKHADKVRRWESPYWDPKLQLEQGIYHAPIDTTFALHRPSAHYEISGIRTGEPYVACHTAWYVDTAHPDPEELYYRQHTRTDINHWDGIEIPKSLQYQLAFLRN